MKLILASGSPRRKEILKKFNFKFRVIRPKINEGLYLKRMKGRAPEFIASVLAHEKAEKAAEKIKKGVILGSDTIVARAGEIMGKPRSKKDAFRILSALSKSVHYVITGIALIDAETGKSAVSYDATKIFFKRMSPRQIENYINNNSVMDKAGSYAIQEGADPFVRKYEGSYYNIVGLPIEKLKKLLEVFEKI